MCRCNDSTCVDISARCDGAAQCPDGSDEADCPTAACAEPDARPCATAPSCYAPDQRCDARADCPDASDEADCPAPALGPAALDAQRGAAFDEPLLGCSAEQFQCGGDGAVECVPLAWRCDGRVDCSDGSDETEHCGVYHICRLHLSYMLCEYYAN